MAIRCVRDRKAHVAVPYAAALEPASYTASCEFRVRSAPAANGDAYHIIGKGNFDTVNSASWAAIYKNDAGTMKLIAGHLDTGTNEQIMTYTVTLELGRWYALFWSYDDTSKDQKLHTATLADVRGQGGDTTYTEQATNTATGTVKLLNAPVEFGFDNDGTADQGANIDVTEIALYNAEISKATMDGRLGTRLAGNETSIVGYWRADEGLGGVGGSTVYDRSGNGHNGTIQNDALWVGDPSDLLYTTNLVTDRGVLGWHNAVMRPGATVTASSEDAAYLGAELRNPKQVRVTRTPNVSGSKNWVFSFGAPTPVDLITIENHNLTSKASITTELNASDSWGSPTVSDTVTFHPSRLAHFLTRRYGLAFGRIIISDSTNPDGYIELGAVGFWYLFKGHFQPIADSAILVDPSVAVETQHRQLTKRTLTKSRDIGFQWATLKRGQADELRRVMRDAAGLGYVWGCSEPQRYLYSGSAYGPLAEVPGFSLHDPSWDHGETGAIRIEGDYA